MMKRLQLNNFIFVSFQKRKLDSVYYYMRSLAASNPFVTARESLMTLFDEARKKVSLFLIIIFFVFSVPSSFRLFSLTQESNQLMFTN